MVTLAGLVPVEPGMPMGPGPLMFMPAICHGWRVGVGAAEVRPARASARERAVLRRELKNILAGANDNMAENKAVGGYLMVRLIVRCLERGVD